MTHATWPSSTANGIRELFDLRSRPHASARRRVTSTIRTRLPPRCGSRARCTKGIVAPARRLRRRRVLPGAARTPTGRTSRCSTSTTCDQVFRDAEHLRLAPRRRRGIGRPRRHGVERHALHGRRAAPPLPRAGAALVRAQAGASGGSSNWIDSTVDALIDTIGEQGRADLNVDFCAAIPMLTICGQLRRVGARRPRHAGRA